MLHRQTLEKVQIGLDDASIQKKLNCAKVGMYQSDGGADRSERRKGTTGARRKLLKYD